MNCMRRIKLRMSSTIGVALFVLSSTVHAVLITASPGGTVVDFSQFGGPFVFGSGPEQVGGLVGRDIVWTSTSDNSVIGNGGYGLGDNGFWNSGRDGYVGLNNTFVPGFHMRFDFNDGPVHTVGGFVNYAICGGPQCDPAQEFIIDVLGVGDVVLESYNISQLAPISTPNQTNAGAFRGISRNSADIIAFRLFNAVDVLDDLEFIATPEPSSVALIGLGLVMLAFKRSRTTKN